MKSKSKTPASIIDVAREANVSVATVSRVVNNRDNVTEATRVHVKAVIEALGYVQSAAHKRKGRPRNARSYFSERVVSFVFLGIDAEKLFEYPVFPTILRGVEKGLRESGIRLMVMRITDDASARELLSENDLHGMVLMGKAELSEAVQNRMRQLPAVWVMTHGFPWGDHIMPDHYRIGEIAFHHLYAQGWRKPAVLNIHPGHPGFKLRVNAFLQAAKEAGISAHSFIGERHYPLDLTQPELKATEMAKTAARMIEQADAFDSLFVVSDYQTALLYRSFHEMGKFPTFPIISSDNEERLLAGLHPRPATIDIESEYIGWRAARQLVMRMEFPDDRNFERIMVTPILLPGE